MFVKLQFSLLHLLQKEGSLPNQSENKQSIQEVLAMFKMQFCVQSYFIPVFKVEAYFDFFFLKEKKEGVVDFDLSESGWLHCNEESRARSFRIRCVL